MALDYNKIRCYDFTVLTLTLLFLFFGLYGLIDINNPDSKCYLCKSHYNKAYQHNKIVCVPGNVTIGNSEIYYKNAEVSPSCKAKWGILIAVVVISFVLGSGYLSARLCFPLEFLYDVPDSQKHWYQRV